MPPPITTTVAPLLHPGHLEPLEAAGCRLGERGGAGVEPLREQVHVLLGEHDTLREAADPHGLRALADSAQSAVLARATSVIRLAGDGLSHQAPAHALADIEDGPAVLVPHHAGRGQGKEALDRVDVAAADARGVNSDQDLPGPGSGLGQIVHREAILSVPGCRAHDRSSRALGA